jgi:hypothetical protein
MQQHLWSASYAQACLPPLSSDLPKSCLQTGLPHLVETLDLCQGCGPLPTVVSARGAAEQARRAKI